MGGKFPFFWAAQSFHSRPEFNGEKNIFNVTMRELCVIEIQNHWSFARMAGKCLKCRKIIVVKKRVFHRLFVLGSGFRMINLDVTQISTLCYYFSTFSSFFPPISTMRYTLLLEMKGEKSVSWIVHTRNPSNLKQINYMSWWFFRQLS